MNCIILHTVPSWLYSIWQHCRWRLSSLILLLGVLCSIGTLVGLGLGYWYTRSMQYSNNQQIIDEITPMSGPNKETNPTGSEHLDLMERANAPDSMWHFTLLKQWDHSLRGLRIKLDTMSFNGPSYCDKDNRYYLDISLSFTGSPQQLIKLFDYQHQLQSNTQWTNLEWRTDSKKQVNLNGKIKLTSKIVHIDQNSNRNGDPNQLLASTQLQPLPPIAPNTQSLSSITQLSTSHNQQDWSPEELVMVGWLTDQTGATVLLQTPAGEVVRIKKGNRLGKEQELVLKINRNSLITDRRIYEL